MMTTKKDRQEPQITSMFAARASNQTNKSQPERAVSLGFVDLAAKGHVRPKEGEQYDLIPASSEALETLPTPTTRFKRLDLDLYEFYSADLPDFWGANEGLIKVNVDTRDPQAMDGSPTTAGFASRDVSATSTFTTVTD